MYQLNLFPLFILLLVHIYCSLLRLLYHLFLKALPRILPIFFQKGAFKKKLNHNPWKKKVFFDIVFWIVYAPFWMPLVHSAIAFKAFQYYTEQCPPMHSLHDHVKMSDADTLFFSWENLRLIFRVVNVIVV